MVFVSENNIKHKVDNLLKYRLLNLDLVFMQSELARQT